MIVCICHRVNDREIKSISNDFQISTLEELQACVDVCKTCRKCEQHVKSLLNDAGECVGSTGGS